MEAPRRMSAVGTASSGRLSANGKPSSALEVTEAKRLRTPEEECSKLKKLLAEAILTLRHEGSLGKKSGAPMPSGMRSLMFGTVTG